MYSHTVDHILILEIVNIKNEHLKIKKLVSEPLALRDPTNKENGPLI